MRKRQVAKWLLGIAVGMGAAGAAIPAIALMTSVGEAGINALRLHAPPYNLTGRKISIGQVEIGRPARFGLDKTLAEGAVVPVDQVFVRENLANPNQLVDGHAASVASVMISNDKSLTGVAPDARLYAAATGLSQSSGQPQECLSSQLVATQNGGDVRAINFSFGESLRRDPRPNAMLDGNALLTQCIDWSAIIHGTLYVIAGNQGTGGIPIPTDNFNGINVASSKRVDGEFSRVDFSNLGSEPTFIVGRRPELESNVGPRRSITLVAPGVQIAMLNPDAQPTQSSGTSFAAPHVTATVALLQEFGDRQIRDQQPNWSLSARQPEVMKAVLLNAADKVRDTGNGYFLGMDRTLLTPQGDTWLDSDAYIDPKIPLDAQLGTGHLNAYRAYEQFSPGQWSPNAPVPARGWDYGQVGQEQAPAYQDYVIAEPLQGGSYVSVTLAWNRLVTLRDRNQNGLYDLDEGFENQGLNNLDLYLLPVEAEDLSASVASSVSQVDSVEHIFQQIPATGQYKIRVVYQNRVNQADQSYAIAWWARPAGL
jgi:subtilisin family serine protease